MSKRKVLLILGILAAALAMGSVFAATTGTGTLTITTGSSLPGGGLANVTSLSEEFVLYQGAAQRVAGVELARIDLASSTIRNQVMAFVALLNPEDMSQVLTNPNASVEVSLAYRVANGEDYTLSSGEKVKVASDRIVSSHFMTRRNGSLILFPEMGGDATDTDTYWVLGTIRTPGGAPPGQQSQVGTLGILVDVRR